MVDDFIENVRNERGVSNGGGGGYERQNSGSNYNRNGNGYNNSGGNGYNRGNGSNSNNFRKYNNNNGNNRVDEGPTKLYRSFVGTGNREAPNHILEELKELVREAQDLGYTLRTGGMQGPDEVIESVGDKDMELYIPWRNFNDKESKNYFNTPQAMDIARMFHPMFDTMKPAIQAFLAKNARMILGDKLKSPAIFIVCWSEDGSETDIEVTSRTGNVGHVISIASGMHIPVFNLGNPSAKQRLKEFLIRIQPKQEQSNHG